MDPFSQIIAPAFGALMSLGQPADRPPRRYTPPMTAPVPRDKPVADATTKPVTKIAARSRIPDAAGASETALSEPPIGEGDADEPAEAPPPENKAPPPEKKPEVANDDAPVAPPLPEPAPAGPAKDAAGNDEPDAAAAKQAGGAPEASDEAENGAAAAGPDVILTDRPSTGRDLGALVEPVPRPAPDADDDRGALVEPVPRPKPDGPPAKRDGADVERTRSASGSDASPATGAKVASVAPVAPVDRPVVPADPSCLPELAALKVEATALPAIADGSCGLQHPLRLRQLSGGAVGVTPPATVECRVGRALARWVENDVQKVARTEFDAPVTGLRVAAAYSCRGRNNVAGAKLSEHGYGNAIDIAAFEIAGKWIAVAPQEDAATPTAKFLTAVRGTACDHFTTVLGPGSDAYHSDHFHLDMARRGRNGNSRYCQ